MDEQKGYSTHGTMELQQRAKVLEEELAATCAEKEEVPWNMTGYVCRITLMTPIDS